ncbi:MAG: flagellar hook-length control protein FliK [Lachnospiraceae bacterium]|nr:flagellar hook-length control protein FliK [Lachnospiraceae bacterium]
MDGFGHLSGMGHPISRGVSYQSNVTTVDLSQLKQGDVFKGEITAVSGEEVQLYLGNGQYMQARLEHDVQLALGQILNFQVQSNTGDKLVLKPLYQNAYQQRVGEAALKAAGIPVNDKNMQLIAKMIENGLPIHKESVGKLYRQMLATPKASMEQLMQMNRIQLKVTPESLAQYQKYEGLQHSLTVAIQDMADEVFQVYEALQGAAGKDVPQTLPMQSVNVQGAANGAALPVNEQGIPSANQVMTTENMVNDKTTIAGDIPQTIPTQKLTDSVQFMEKMLQIVNDGSNNELVSQTGPTQGTSEQLQTLLGDASRMNPQQVADTLSNALKENKLMLQDLQNLLQAKLSATELGDEFAREVREKLFSTESFRNRLQGEMESQWSLTPDEIMEDKTEHFYKRLYQQSSELAKLMSEATQETSIPARSAQNVQQNIEFMNQLNQVFQYVQLPLKLSENNANGELYVFTNKRNLAKRDGTVTALLHLDMEHLGKLDVHVAMQLETSQVTTRFAVQEELLNFLEPHMEALTQRLKDKGYTCYTSCEIGTEEKSVIDYVEEQMAGTTVPLMYQAFDMRT